MENKCILLRPIWWLYNSDLATHVCIENQACALRYCAASSATLPWAKVDTDVGGMYINIYPESFPYWNSVHQRWEKVTSIVLPHVTPNYPCQYVSTTFNNIITLHLIILNIIIHNIIIFLPLDIIILHLVFRNIILLHPIFRNIIIATSWSATFSTSSSSSSSSQSSSSSSSSSPSSSTLSYIIFPLPHTVWGLLPEYFYMVLIRVLHVSFF